MKKKPKRKSAKKKSPSTANKKPSAQYSFYENVYDVVRLIPKGRVTSYGAIAKYLGTGRSARMVGYAMNASATQIPPVPAHRVLNRNGQLTGKHHFNPPSIMQEMLEREGVKIKKDQVVDFEKLFWDPFEHLEI